MFYQTSRTNMIKQQLRTGGVLQEAILSLFDEIPREEFVPAAFKAFAYSDTRIVLPHQQVMMTPLEEATVLQALMLNGTETVLEVGTGSGFFTALLSRLCKQVISVDCFADLTTNAQLTLAKHQCLNVDLITGNAALGWVDKAPYDVVVFTGALPELTETHRLQVLPGGRLFALVGTYPIMKSALHQLDHFGFWHSKELFETSLPPLISHREPTDFVF